MSPKVIFFAGAPDPSTFDAIPDENRLSIFTAPFSSFLGQPELSTSLGSSNDSQHLEYLDFPSWRSLPLKRRPLEAGTGVLSQIQQPVFSHIHEPTHPNHPGHSFPTHDNFFTTASISFEESTDYSPSQDEETSLSQHGPGQLQQQVLSQFYEESLSHHQNIPSSQLQPGTQLQNDTLEPETTSFITEATTSFQTTSKTFTSEEGNTTSDISIRPPLGPNGAPSAYATTSAAAAATNAIHLSDLEDIPPAKHLISLLPATVTVNLIAGVISVAAPRSVTTRWGREMSLVEVLLGDETRAGFGVTFWLPPEQNRDERAHNPKSRCCKTPGPTTTADTLASLRTQDIILLQNVALHVFKGKVYGQSLRGGLTRVHLLHRKPLDKDDDMGYYRLEDLRGGRKRPRTRKTRGSMEGKRNTQGMEKDDRTHPQLEKTRNVWEWVLQFVGGSGNAARTRTARAGRRDRREDLDRERGRDRESPPDDTQ